MYLSNLDCTEIAILKEVISNTRIQSWFGNKINLTTISGNLPLRKSICVPKISTNSPETVKQ